MRLKIRSSVDLAKSVKVHKCLNWESLKTKTTCVNDEMKFQITCMCLINIMHNREKSILNVILLKTNDSEADDLGREGTC